MKLILSSSLFCALLFIACKKETPTLAENKSLNETEIEVNYETTNKAVLFEFTSTGCPGCGSWGKPTVASVSASHGSKVVPIAVHIKYNDPFLTDISQAIADNRTGSRWTPQLWVDNENATIINSSGYIDAVASIAKMNEGISGKVQDSDLSLGAGFILENKKITTKYGIKLSKAVGEEYYLAAYLMESDLSNDQQGSVNNPVRHNSVIQDAAYGAWGKKITGTGEAQTLEFEHTFAHDASENSYVTLVLWKRIGNRYIVVDASNFN